MFDTFQLTKTLVTLVVLPVAILAVIGAISVVLFIFKPRFYSAFKAMVSPFLKGEWKFLRRFWKQIIFIVIAGFCSTLLVDVLLPDYFDQFFAIRGVYTLLAFGLLSAAIVSHYRFKTDQTWFLRIALASAITLPAALLYYLYNYPAYALIPPPFSYQIQALLTLTAAGLAAASTLTAAIGAISWRQSHGRILARSGYKSSMEFFPTDHKGKISSNLIGRAYLGKVNSPEESYYDDYGVPEHENGKIGSSRRVYWFKLTEMPESYQNADTPEETNPRSFESGRMVSALAMSGIHFGLLVKVLKGKGDTYYQARGRNQADSLEGVLSTLHPGLIHEETGVSLGNVWNMAVVEVRSGYPHLQNVIEQILEYFAQRGCTGVVHAVVEPYGFMSRYLTKRSKKERYREIQHKGQHYLDPQAEVEAARKGYAVTRGDVKAGLYVAVTDQYEKMAESHAQNIASLIRGAFTRDAKVTVITGGGARRRLERMFTLSQSANLDLTFSEAEALTHVPRVEVGGVKVTKTALFSQTLPDIPSRNGILMGHLIRNGRVLRDRPIVLPPVSLTKHFALTAASGYGKTITAMTMLSELGLFEVSRFILELEKREYRNMFYVENMEKHPLIFPIGEGGCWFRYNPLYVYPHETVAQKISDLTWIFNQYFVLYAPMDTVLEIALNLTYEEKGWVWKGEEQVRGETPTLRDVCFSIEVAMEILNYHEEARENIRSGLLARLSTLCTGTMGAMFLCEENTPFEFLRGPLVVFEFEGVGKKTKPFIAFLILYYLYQNIKRQKPSDKLQGVILVEEAHTVFKKQQVNPDSDSRAPQLASEFLQDMFRSMRAQGWGLGVSDQNPTNLPDEVMQNCSTHIAGKQINFDDRECIARNLGLNERQCEALQNLKPEEKVMLIEGYPAILGSVRNLKAEFPDFKQQIDDQFIKEEMLVWYLLKEIPAPNQKSIPSQLEFHEEQRRVRELVKKTRMLVQSRGFAETYPELVENHPEKLEEYLTKLSVKLARESGFKKEKAYHYLKRLAQGNYKEIT
nr:hypothetical protein [Candidatus Freyarchaeota archaeon]